MKKCSKKVKNIDMNFQAKINLILKEKKRKKNTNNYNNK